MTENVANRFGTLLNGAIDNAVTSLDVDSASGFPTVNFRIVVQDAENDPTNREVMLVTGVASLTLTVTRGQEGTSPAAHGDNSYVAHVLTAMGLKLLTGGVDRKIKSGAQSVSVTSFADVSDLTFELEANASYEFEFLVFYFTGATTTGLRLAINGPAGATGRWGEQIQTGATGNDSTWGGGQITAFDTAIVATTSGPGGSPAVARVWGTITTVGTAGTLALRMAAEVAASVTIEVGSYGELKRVA